MPQTVTKEDTLIELPTSSTAADRVLIPLDTTDLTVARGLVERLAGLVGGFKIGKEFFTAHGPQGVRQVLDGAPFFLDLKFHDIPNTVAGAVRSCVAMGPFLVNVHAAGGVAMMKAAAAAAREAAATGGTAPKVIAVTVLTSLDDADLTAVGQQGPVNAQVERLALLAQDCGLDGVVCSPREIAPLRARCGAGFALVTPGIRPLWADRGDQKRIMTPGEAVAAGASYLVIGRPITAAANPQEAAQRIAEEIGSVQDR